MKDFEKGEIFGSKVDKTGKLLFEHYAHKDNTLVVTDLKMQYCQEDDLHSDDFQELNVSIDSSGFGHYYVIETKRWAFDNPEDLLRIINDFKSRITFNDDN